MAATALAWVLTAATAVQALVININAGAALAGNAAALAAFDRAADQYEALFSDPITVTIDADLASLAYNIIGSASSVFLGNGYDIIRDQMVADAAAEADDAIVGYLPTAAGFSAFLPTGFGFNGAMYATKANLKAMGFGGLDTLYGATDATLTFNSAFAFDYDNSDGVGAGLTDFETVAAHEIGHALGFISAVDVVDYYLNQGTPVDIAVNPLDLFRFGPAENPTTLADFTSFARSLVPGEAEFFDDLNVEGLFSTGKATGDGRQASHWKDGDITGTILGVMDPTLADEQIFTISALDIRAFDVIGWDVDTSAPVPEPATLVVFGLGLAGMGWLRRRRRA